jgi:DNA-binding NarL/FixJ family response regulator
VRKTSVLLVDDNRQFREHASTWLSREDDIEIVGSAANAAEAIALAERLRPCVVLMDIAMPDMNGIEATRQLKRLPNAPAVLVLTLHGDPAYRAAAAAAGAEGFLNKADFATELLPCLRRVCRETPGAATAARRDA